MNFKRKDQHGAKRRNDTTGWSNPLTYQKKLEAEGRHIGRRTNQYCKRLKGKHDFSQVVEEKVWHYVFKKAKCSACGKTKYLGSEYLEDKVPHVGEVVTR